MDYHFTAPPSTLIDHESLHHFLVQLHALHGKAALVGFGEYAKHLVNLIPEKVAGIYDPDPLYQGIVYRGVPTVGIDTPFDCQLILVCEYKLGLDFTRQVMKRHPGVPAFRPPRLHYIQTGEIDVFAQETMYRRIFAEEREAPASMMAPEKRKFLMELLRYGLTFPGNIVELGSWQGGSTWFMAKVLSFLGENRKLFAVDLFEKHAIDHTSTVSTDEVRRKLAFYPGSVCLDGLIDDDAILAQIEGPLCFAHIDLGCVDKPMEFIWERMSLGAPLLFDNYGHIETTYQFDDFAARKGAHIIRFPWSEQGLMFKR